MSGTGKDPVPAARVPAPPATLPASLVAACEVLGALVANGVRDLVLAPGSRSAPFVPVALALEEAGAVRVRVVLDERSAGFTALGAARAHLARGRRQGAAVVTTSGTAVANLHPAVLEADAAGVPLVLVTADRPHELVGTGASQTTEQVALFGRAVRCVVDLPADLACELGPAASAALEGQVRRVVAAATGALTNDPGPAQLNARFRPRLALPEEDPHAAWEGLRAWAAALARAVRAAAPHREETAGTGGGASVAPAAPVVPQRGIVLAGDLADGSGAVAAALAQDLGWPLMAEPTSGARGAGTALRRYAELLGTARGGELVAGTERVVVAGHPSLTRQVSALLARTDLRIDVLTPTATWNDVAGTARDVVALPVLDRLASDLGEQARRHARWVCDRLRLGPGPQGWWQRWYDAVAALGPAAAQPAGAVGGQHVPGHEQVLTPAAAALEVWRACLPDRPGREGGLPASGDGSRVPGTAGEGTALVVGSSMTIRYLDRLAPTGAGSQPPLTLANRGLAGIDGTIATAVGAWSVWGRPVRVLVGDLTFLHDAMSLGRGALEEEPDLQVIVLDDAGGAIFSTLEYPGVTPEQVMARGFSTRQTAEVASLAGALGARTTQVRTAERLRQVLEEPITGLSVVHVTFS